ncbi:MAG: beta-ketoacyl-ACP synthase III [Desulfosarcina sp.]|nr:beta-ketoacyl-ACP synthase III [Desulfobacterales bacterium]
MSVYINDLASFLPNEPIGNDRIEDVLGKINAIPSKSKAIMLRNNRIQQRYYAIDPETGAFTHSNAQLTAEAVRRLKPTPDFKPADIECLCCGTTSPDVLIPGHALMVMGELGLPPIEAVSTAGICIAGMTAFKYANMNVAAGASRNAVATGSELASSFMRADFFHISADPGADLKNRPILAFDADFLRWMLSDGAGAAYLSDRPNEDGVSLRIDWIENISFAGELETCMYAGGWKNGNGSVTGWRAAESMQEAARQNYMAVRQDARLLGREIVRTMTRALSLAAAKHGLAAEAVDWFLPHYSSHYFRDKFQQGMQTAGFDIPIEKWFTNLYTTGNIGSASIFVIMEDLFKSGRLEADQKLLCFIPESGRFSHCFMMLTVIY